MKKFKIYYKQKKYLIDPHEVINCLKILINIDFEEIENNFERKNEIREVKSLFAKISKCLIESNGFSFKDLK